MGRGKAKQGEVRQHEPHQAPMALNTEPKLPRLQLNMTLQEWTRWKSRWATYKYRTGLTNEDDCLDYLWKSVSEEVPLVVINNLELDVDLSLELGTTEGQFLKQVKRHAACHVATVAEKAEVAKEVLVETPQAGGSIANQAKEVAESSTLEQHPLKEQEQLPPNHRAEAREGLIETPQAGEIITNKDIAEFSAPEQQKAKPEEVVVIIHKSRSPRGDLLTRGVRWFSWFARHKVCSSKGVRSPRGLLSSRSWSPHSSLRQQLQPQQPIQLSVSSTLVGKVVGIDNPLNSDFKDLSSQPADASNQVIVNTLKNPG